MNNKITTLSEMAEQVMGPDADYIVIAHKKGQCGGIVKGNIDNIAQTLFALIHQQGEDLSKAVFKIIKLNAMNIIANPSPYAAEFLAALTDVTPKDDE